MEDIESDVKVEERRFGAGSEDVITLCKRSGDANICRWPCPLYQKCWADLHSDERGYFPFRGEEVKSF